MNYAFILVETWFSMLLLLITYYQCEELLTVETAIRDILIFIVARHDL